MRHCLWIALFILPGCSTSKFNLTGVSVPVLANDAGYESAMRVPFDERAKNVLWFHGLFGETVPDVGEMVEEELAGAEAIVGFRVTQGASFHDWLITHLSLTLVRMKTVRVTGAVVSGAPEPPVDSRP
ncbi:MAG: hypothetical protein RL885_23895 [Planctomycetota bacterium]